MEIHHYKAHGTKYRFEITITDDSLQIDRYVNDRFKERESYSANEYSYLRQCITDSMAAIGAVRDWN